MINGEIKKIDKRERNRAAGLLLHLLRRRTGRQLKALAKELGITPSYLSMLENGARLISLDMIHRLSSTLSLCAYEKRMLMKAAGYCGSSFETYWAIQDIFRGTLVFLAPFKKRGFHP